MSARRTEQCASSGARQPRPGQREHRLARIHAERLTDPRREQFQQPPGAGADVEQPAEPASRHQRQQRGLDRRGRQVQRAHLVPIGALAAEAFRGDAGPFGQHPRRLAAIRRQHRIIIAAIPASSSRASAPASPGGEANQTFAPSRTRSSSPLRRAASGGGTGAAGDWPRISVNSDDAERAPPGERQQPQPGRLGGGAQGWPAGVPWACM